jgi:hypothetical protein
MLAYIIKYALIKAERYKRAVASNVLATDPQGIITHAAGIDKASEGNLAPPSGS